MKAASAKAANDNSSRAIAGSSGNRAEAALTAPVIQPKFVQIITDDAQQFEEDGPAIAAYVGERRERWIDARFEDMPKTESLFINAHMDSNSIGGYSTGDFVPALKLKGFKGAKGIRLLGCNEVDKPQEQSSRLRSVLSVEHNLDTPVFGLRGVMKVINKDIFAPQVITVPWGQRHDTVKARYEQDLVEADIDPNDKAIAKARTELEHAIHFQKPQKQKKLDELILKKQQNPDTPAALAARRRAATINYRQQLDVVSYAAEWIADFRKDLITAKNNGQITFNDEAWISGNVSEDLLPAADAGADVKVAEERMAAFKQAVIDRVLADDFDDERMALFNRDFQPILSAAQTATTEGTLTEAQLSKIIRLVNNWISVHGHTRKQTGAEKSHQLEQDIYAICDQIKTQLGAQFMDPFMDRIAALDGLDVNQRIQLLDQLLSYLKKPDLRTSFEAETNIYDLADKMVTAGGNAAVDDFMEDITGIDQMTLVQRIDLWNRLNKALAKL